MPAWLSLLRLVALGAAFAAAGPVTAQTNWGADGESIEMLEGTLVPGPVGSPIFVVSDKVYHLGQQRIVARLKDLASDARVSGSQYSLDGLRVAMTVWPRDNTSPYLAVWSTVTGEQILRIPMRRGPNAVQFVDDDSLIVCINYELRLYDLESGAMVETLDVEHVTTFAVSPDERVMAVVGRHGLVVADRRHLRALVTPEAPASGRFAVRALAFSPDGTMLAALMDSRPQRVLWWDTAGDLLGDAAVFTMGSERLYDLRWLPDASGWVAGRWLIDRASGRTVARIGNEGYIHVADADTFVTHAGGERKIPWPQIRASIAMLDQPALAHIAPGAAVSVDVTVARSRGDVNQARQLLTEGATKMLERSGVRVANGQPTTLEIRLVESAGDRLPIYEKQSRFDFRGKDTGRHATEAAGAITVALRAAGREEPLWETSFNAHSDRSFDDEAINDATLRRSMLRSAREEFVSLTIPYFIPKSPAFVALPVIID